MSTSLKLEVKEMLTLPTEDMCCICQNDFSDEKTWNAENKDVKRIVVHHRNLATETYTCPCDKVCLQKWLTASNDGRNTTGELIFTCPSCHGNLSEKGFTVPKKLTPKPPLTLREITIGRTIGKVLALGANAAIVGLSMCALAALVASVVGNSIMQAGTTGLQQGAFLGVILPVAVLVIREVAEGKDLKELMECFILGDPSEVLAQREIIRNVDSIQKCALEFLKFFATPSSEAILLGSFLILAIGIVVGLSS